jgi:hypothetical protein
MPVLLWQVSLTQVSPLAQFCVSEVVHCTHSSSVVSQTVRPEALLAQSESELQPPVPASGMVAATHWLLVQESRLFTQSDGWLQRHWPPEQICPFALPMQSLSMEQPVLPASGVGVIAVHWPEVHC